MRSGAKIANLRKYAIEIVKAMSGMIDKINKTCQLFTKKQVYHPLTQYPNITEGFQRADLVG